MRLHLPGESREITIEPVKTDTPAPREEPMPPVREPEPEPVHDEPLVPA